LWKVTPETVLGPLDKLPTKVMFFLSATALANSSTR